LAGKRYRSDEPRQAEDYLGRRRYAEALAEVVQTAETPFVLGLFGTWGSGKTSMMRLISSALPREEVCLVWFDAWRHQFAEEPVAALFHAFLAEAFQHPDTEQLRKGYAAVRDAAAKAVLGVTWSDLAQGADTAMARRYLPQQRSEAIHTAFGWALDVALARGEDRLKDLMNAPVFERRQQFKQVVFFVDDLDRCLPENTLRMIEALKLYMTFPGCVYVLGADRQAIERAIDHHYDGKVEIDGSSYLDKIVQLEFAIPDIPEQRATGFVLGQLASVPELNPAAQELGRILPANPRQVVRFTNTLKLHWALLLEAMPGRALKPRPAAALSYLWQYHRPQFHELVQNPARFKLRVSADPVAQHLQSARVFDLPTAELIEYCLAISMASVSARGVDGFLTPEGLAVELAQELRLPSARLDHAVVLHRTETQCTTLTTVLDDRDEDAPVDLGLHLLVETLDEADAPLKVWSGREAKLSAEGLHLGDRLPIRLDGGHEQLSAIARLGIEDEG